MQKLHPVLFLLIILALAISACGQLTPPEAATKAPEPATTTADQPVPTQPSIETPPAAATPAAEPAATIAAVPVKAECRVDDSAQVDAEQANRFPKVGDVEWFKGAETAYVIIDEYMDFQ
jgi:Na+-transporting methylmalonyl-CoA/oxaloacetate decarboxylase gamma subunit